MSKEWYFVEVLQLYDRSYIVVDKFITQTPNKYKGGLYRLAQIKVK